MDDLSLRVYLENGSDAMRGGWLELPVVPERLDAFMRGVVGVDDGGGYAVVDHEPGWFGDVLGSDLESFSVSSLNLAARCVAHARDLAVADSVDGDVFLDMLATAAESEDVRFPSGIAALAARAGDVAEFWTEYSLPDSWRAGNSSPDELYGAHVAYGLMGDDAYSSLSYCMDLERLGRGNFVFLAVRATDGSGRRAGVDLPMDPDELARFEGEQGLMAPSDYRIDGYSKDGIVGRMGFAPFRDDSPLEDVNLLCRAVDAASRSDPHAADKVAAWAECWEVDDPRVLAGVAVRSAADPTNMAVTAAESGRAL